MVDRPYDMDLYDNLLKACSAADVFPNGSELDRVHHLTVGMFGFRLRAKKLF